MSGYPPRRNGPRTPMPTGPLKKFEAKAARPAPTDADPTKKRWIGIGSAIEWTDGSLSVDLEAIPTGWDGKFKLFVKDPFRRDDKDC